MQCPKCQTENPESKKFCRECGAELMLVCPHCGTALGPEDKFCGDCGQKLAGESLTQKSESMAPDAERKQVTALFSDLSGYTAMTERLDPEEVKEITGRIFDGVRGIVGKYDGFIERFAGDGVLALFGVPKSHEDDPIRAIRAAREIHELVEGMNPVYEAKVGAHLSMHSGINTGLAVTADVDPSKGTHGITGDAINIAARLSDLAKAGEIFVGPATCSRAEGHFALEALEPAKLKGKSEPIPVYKVLSIKEEPITVHRQSGLRADLIGRNAELTQLQEAVERLKTGTASIIAVCGEPGTGKSRLIDEFKCSLDLDKIRWREGHAYQYAQNISYFPLIDLMNRAWKIEEGDSPTTVRDKIESGIERLLGNTGQVVPYVGSLYALAYPEIEDVSPEFWRSRLFEGVQAIVAALTEYGPTVFCFEDIHWADPSTLDLLRYLISQLRHPALFLCLYRPPFSLFTSNQLKSLGKSYEEIRLQDLSRSDTQEMLKSLLKAESIPSELRRFVLDKIEGNPFYLEEAINSLLESGMLARENGGWRVTRQLVESDVPATVQGVIAARLDRLDHEMKRILQEASVIGRAFLYEILKKVTEIHEPIDRFLSGLERMDLIRARSLEPELEYIFKHALTQEVVYNGLLKKERQELHERIGLAMEHLFQDRLAEFYETLAFHFKQGLSLRKAADYLMKSGAKNLHRYAIEESNQCYQEAYNILTSAIEKTRVEETLLIDLLLQWALVLYYFGDFKRTEELFGSHMNLAESVDDKSKLGQFYAWFGWSKCWRTSFRIGYQYLLKSLKLGEEIKDQQVIGYASMWLLWVCGELAMLDEALLHGTRAQDIALNFPEDEFLHYKTLAGLGYVHFTKGDRTKVLEAAQGLLEYGQKRSHIRSAVMGHITNGMASLLDGNFQEGIQCGQEAVRLTSDPCYAQYAKAALALTYGQARQARRAEDLSSEVIVFAMKHGTEWYSSVVRPVLGIALILQGHMKEGLGLIHQAEQAYLETGQSYYYAVMKQVLGSLYLQIGLGEGDLSLPTVINNLGFLIKNVPFASRKAETHFNEAIRLAEEIGAKGILGQSYLDLGRLHKAKKRIEKARECLTKAIEYFELCEAETFLKQAKEELQSLV
jgi:class 3 adenylate cyclase/tetratricopeptide (TPR) repeat protein